MSTSLEGSLEFEVIEAAQTSQQASTVGSLENERIMYVSSSSIRSGNGGGDGDDHTLDSSEDYDEVQHLSNSEKNARLIGRRIDILTHPEDTTANQMGGPSWERGTILNFDRLKDVHWVLPDGQRVRKEYKLSEIVFRLVETEEEWVDVGDQRQHDPSYGREEDGMTDTDESL